MPYRATLPVRSKRGAAQWPTNRRMRAFNSSRAAREQPLGTRVRPIPKPPLAGRSSTSRREEQGSTDPADSTLFDLSARSPPRPSPVQKRNGYGRQIDHIRLYDSDDRPSSEEEVKQTQCGVSRPILRRISPSGRWRLFLLASPSSPRISIRFQSSTRRPPALWAPLAGGGKQESYKRRVSILRSNLQLTEENNPGRFNVHSASLNSGRDNESLLLYRRGEKIRRMR
jgi:hypothetical protein